MKKKFLAGLQQYDYKRNYALSLSQPQLKICFQNAHVHATFKSHLVTSTNEVDFKELYDEICQESPPQVFDRTFTISKDNLTLVSQEPPVSILLAPENLEVQRQKSALMSQNEKINFFLVHLREAFYRFDRSLLSLDGFSESIKNMGIEITSEFTELTKKKRFDLSFNKVIQALSSPVEDISLKLEYHQIPEAPNFKLGQEESVWKLLQRDDSSSLATTDENTSNEEKVLLLVKQMGRGFLTAPGFVKKLKELKLETNPKLNCLLLKTERTGEVSFKDYASVIFNHKLRKREDELTDQIAPMEKTSDQKSVMESIRPKKTLLQFLEELKKEGNKKDFQVLPNPAGAAAKQRKQELLKGNIEQERIKDRIKAHGEFQRDKLKSQIQLC
eukprot:snap_masked-scaffold_4-processed-gene-3.39-mRNA-1 protein AED:1.00 eAED:1.00 QI:0/0/0/0/1/1/2/0/386